MNIASAQLLQNSLQHLGDTFARTRQQEAEQAMRKSQLENEARRTQVDQAFRDAQMQHYSNVEDKLDNAAATQQQQNAMTQKQDLLKTVMGLNATGQLTDDARGHVNKWLSTDQDLSKTGMQLAAPPNPSTDPNHKQSALTQAVTLIQSYREQAGQMDDPEKANELNHAADLLEKNLPAAVKATAAPTAGYTTTTVRQVPPPLGSTTPLSLTNTVSRVPYTMPPGAPLTPPMGGSAVNVNGQATGKIRMQNPAGGFGYVPQEQAQAALAQGYKLAPPGAQQ